MELEVFIEKGEVVFRLWTEEQGYCISSLELEELKEALDGYNDD